MKPNELKRGGGKGELTEVREYGKIKREECYHIKLRRRKGHKWGENRWKDMIVICIILILSTSMFKEQRCTSNN